MLVLVSVWRVVYLGTGKDSCVRGNSCRKDVGGCVWLCVYSLLLDLVTATGLSLRNFDSSRKIAPHVVVRRLVAAVGQ